MDKFPAYKVFFVLLEGNSTVYPLAVTIYENYRSEDIFEILLEELVRQSNCYSIHMPNGNTLLSMDGVAMNTDEINYDLFESQRTYVMNVEESKV